jgi:exodeoxyribonuclease VII small subunit
MTFQENADPEFASWLVVLADGTFEEVLAALEQVVRRLEDGQLPLDESVDCYELGVRLAERGALLLDAAELRVSRLGAEPDRGAADDPSTADDWT